MATTPENLTETTELVEGTEIETPEAENAEVPELDAPQPDEAAEAESSPAAEASFGSPFGLMFQAAAPVEAPRRSRRAPAPVDEAGESEPEADQDAKSDSDESGDEGSRSGRRRRRGGRGRSRKAEGEAGNEDENESNENPNSSDRDGDDESGSAKRRRRRRRSGSAGDSDDPPGTVTKVRESRRGRDEVQGVKGSTRLEAKKQRRREGREAGRRRTIITEAEFLARRESVERTMVVRTRGERTQIGVLEDNVLVEHYVSRDTTDSMAGNIYLGRVQNVLPSMEAAFVDIGKGRNAVLYAGEVNWDAAGLEANQPKRIENALNSGETVLVQVTKDPIGHKGARLTSQISLPGRFLVYVPEGGMTGISRKLPDTERTRLKKILKEIVPEDAGVIVRTAAEGASEEDLRADVERLKQTWEKIQEQVTKKKGKKGGAPTLVYGEPDLTVRVIRDIFNEDFSALVVSGSDSYNEIRNYVDTVAPDLADRLSQWTSEGDVFAEYRIDEQLAKAMDGKVWLPSGGSLVIDRTEAMTVIDVNTGRFVGSGGNLEETVTKNNLEAAEEIVRQLRLRDVGGIIVVDFIDMVLESNRDLVIRRLLECLGRDRTKHQVAEVTSLGLVQMTRKRVGAGLIEAFSTTCDHCHGRGIIVHADPVDADHTTPVRNTKRRGKAAEKDERPTSGPTAAQIAAAAHAAAVKASEPEEPAAEATAQDAPVEVVREGAAEKAEPAKAEPATTEPAKTPRRRGGRRAAGTGAPVNLQAVDLTSAAPAGEKLTRLAAEASPSTDVATDEPTPVATNKRKHKRVTAAGGPPEA